MIGLVIGLGLLVGLAARFVFERHGIGTVKSVVIGGAGAALGWWLGLALTRHANTASQALWAVGGALVLLLAVHVLALRGLLLPHRPVPWRRHLVKRRFRW